MATKKKGTKKRTKYASMVHKKKLHCEGKATVADVKKAAHAYVAHAETQAKKKARAGNKEKAGATAKKKAQSKANKVLNKSCKVSKSHTKSGHHKKGRRTTKRK